MMHAPTLSVVFATMNRLAHVQSTIDSLRRELDGKHSYEIVVVDGNSTDGTTQYLRTMAAQAPVRLIQEDTPRGCCYAFDLGLRAARGHWVSWINDDVDITPGAFDKMLSFMTNPANAGVGIGAFPNSASRDALHTFVVRGVWEFPAVYADFGCIRRSLLEELGFLDLAFRKYGWDPDLSLRVWDKGLRVVPCEGANIIHYFAEDALRAHGDVHAKKDCQYLLAKWEEKRRAGRFYAAYADAAFRELCLRLLAGWPRVFLRLHYGLLDGLDGDARALFLSNPEEMAPTYYFFGLECLKRHRFSLALPVMQALAAWADPAGHPMHHMLPWYRFKAAECLERSGQPQAARAWLDQAAACDRHVMTRLALYDEHAPLAAVLGGWNGPLPEGAIHVPMDRTRAFDWQYYFATRGIDQAFLQLDCNEFQTDPRFLARMLHLFVAPKGRVTVRLGVNTPSTQHMAQVLERELAALGFCPIAREPHTQTYTH